MLSRARSFAQRWYGIDADDSELVLKEVKEIFPELKEEAENKRMINSIIWHLRNSVNNGDTDHSAGQLEEWLLNLKTDSNYVGIIDGQLWRPTDEQMKALDIALRCGINPSTWEGDALRSLISDLKRLIV